MVGAGEPDAAGTARAAKDRSTASTLGHGDERGDGDEREDQGDKYEKRFCEIAKSKLNPAKRKYIDETGFGDLKSISSFTVLHDLMEWLAMNIDTGKHELRRNENKAIVFTRDMVRKVFNIPSGNRPIELYKRHEQCDLRSIYHKNGRAPIAHTVDVLYKARNDDGDTTKSFGLCERHRMQHCLQKAESEVLINDAPKADEHGGSKQTFRSKASDERGSSRQGYSIKVANQTTTNKVVVEPAEGARSNCSSSSAHEPNAGNVVELHAESSVGANEVNVEKEQVEGGEDVEHVGLPKPKEEPVVLRSSREPSPDRDEEKARLKDENKVKSKKRAVSPISAGAKYKKIKIDNKTEAMYQYFVMKRYKMKKIKEGEIE
ncbi:hypothetical protein ZWY2020_023061 [Hordeum vulgare]|nr:hypothetical protein ZWY2020_023061 [Hordeum vulgare]